MKFLVLAAAFAVSSAQVLVTHPNGAVVPADTLEVQAARAAHLGHAVYPYALGAYPYGGQVAYANGAVVPADTPEVYAAKVAHAAAGGAVRPVGVVGYPYAYAGRVAHPNGAVVPVGVVGYPYAYAGLVAHPNGAIVPVEPADVVQARADHLAAHSA